MPAQCSGGESQRVALTFAPNRIFLFGMDGKRINGRA
jgi:hypothetical protein